MRLHFVGIAGSGMSALAQYWAIKGATVSGSDRSLDQGEAQETRQVLERLGARIYPQDGSGVTPEVDAVIVSTAVETHIPDVTAAGELGVTVRHRSELLADLVNTGSAVTIAGTSGKSTITGMVGHLLSAAGRNPSIINGGRMPNFAGAELLGNAVAGTGPLIVEADESDGTLERYFPIAGLLANISKDHQDLSVLMPLFESYLGRISQTAILGIDCPRVASLADKHGHAVSYGWTGDAQYQGEQYSDKGWGSRFRCQGHHFELRLPGRHNALNALGAIATVRELGVSWPEISDALPEFKGIRRRLEILGEGSGCTVIDDFGHNPEKIDASLQTLTSHFQRLQVLFQWHGYGPARFLGEEAAEVFAARLRSEDRLYVPGVYYGGGTVQAEPLAERFAEAARRRGVAATYDANRQNLLAPMVRCVTPGSAAVVMGARDDTLRTFAMTLLRELQDPAH